MIATLLPQVKPLSYSAVLIDDRLNVLLGTESDHLCQERKSYRDTICFCLHPGQKGRVS